MPTLDINAVFANHRARFGKQKGELATLPDELEQLTAEKADLETNLEERKQRKADLAASGTAAMIDRNVAKQYLGQSDELNRRLRIGTTQIEYIFAELSSEDPRKQEAATKLIFGETMVSPRKFRAGVKKISDLYNAMQAIRNGNAILDTMENGKHPRADDNRPLTPDEIAQALDAFEEGLFTAAKLVSADLKSKKKFLEPAFSGIIITQGSNVEYFSHGLYVEKGKEWPDTTTPLTLVRNEFRLSDSVATLLTLARQSLKDMNENQQTAINESNGPSENHDYYRGRDRPICVGTCETRKYIADPAAKNDFKDVAQVRQYERDEARFPPTKKVEGDLAHVTGTIAQKDERLTELNSVKK